MERQARQFHVCQRLYQVRPDIAMRRPAASPSAMLQVARRWAGLLMAALLPPALVACGGPLRAPVPGLAQTALPAAWQAPLPHGGQTRQLLQWWSGFDDPLVARLVDAAQKASPSIASARSRLQQARAGLTTAAASLQPGVDLRAGAARGRPDRRDPTASTRQLLAGASWEIDLFGAHAAGAEAALARLDAAGQAWHEARVLVAAEVALHYASLRACQAQGQLARDDAGSREQTERLTALATGAGFQSSANLGQARAAAAQGRQAVVVQQAACDSLVKLLVELCDWPEPALRAEMAAGQATLPMPTRLRVDSVPADVLSQRPDIARALSELRAASADLAQATAQRLPQISLAGTLGHMRLDSGDGGSSAGRVWSFGPLQVSLPLWDGGRLQAAQDAAHARYVEAELLFKARARTAVREVEDALLSLDAASQRDADARTAVAGHAQSLQGVQRRHAVGLASLFELEDARRSALAARVALVELQLQQVSAWIALYKALGGGWSAADSAVACAGAVSGAGGASGASNVSNASGGSGASNARGARAAPCA